MKLTKQAKNELRSILNHLERADSYLMQPRIAICQRAYGARTTLHYERKCRGCPKCVGGENRNADLNECSGSGSFFLYEVAKEVGSDLAGKDFAIRGLKEFLERYDGTGAPKALFCTVCGREATKLSGGAIGCPVHGIRELR